MSEIMFNVNIMVHAKKLAAVLWLLDGQVIGEPKIRPVRGAKQQGNKVVSAQPLPGADLTTQVAHFIKARDLEKITVDEIRQLVVEAGGKPEQTSGVTHRLRRSGIIGKANRKGKGAVSKVLT